MIPEDVKKLAKVLKYLTKNSFNDNFSNVCIALRIALFAGEHCQEKLLEIDKKLFIYTMSQEHLVELSFISIEFYILQTFKIDLIIEDFANKKPKM